VLNRVLFAIEKWCDADPRCGETNSLDMLVGTLRNSGLAREWEVFHYDETARELGWRGMEESLWEKCRSYAPDLLVHTPIVVGGPNPSKRLLSCVRDELKTPVYVQFFDTPGNEHMIEPFFACASACGFIDAEPPLYWNGAAPCKIVSSWSAADETVFYDDGRERDVDVSFVGTLWGNSRRRAGVEFLRANGIDVLTGGGQHAALGCRPMPRQEYADILRRSKIVLNFSVWDDGRQQCKGRVFEALACGAFLLEEENFETRRFFDEGVDYVSFDGLEDLLDKCRHFLAHENERREIAARGHETVLRKWNSRLMWENILAGMGLLAPDSKAAFESAQRMP
jgi:hypothetical protein